MERLCDKQRMPYIKRYLSNKDISIENLKTLHEFDDHCKSKYLTINSRFSYLKLLTSISKHSNKNIKKLDKKDITHFFANIRNRNPLSKNYGKELSKETIWTYQTCLIEVYKWLERVDLVDFLKSIRVKRARNGKLKREDILTEEEVKLLVDSARNLRNKTLIFVIYETDCRLSEIANLRIKDVRIEENGIELNIKFSKTEDGKRTAFIIDSAPLLKQYLEQHRYKDNPESPLWINVFDQSYRGKKSDEPLSLDGIYRVIKETAQRSGIKKRVFTHLLRHSRTCHLLKSGMPPTLVQKIGGWADLQQLNRYGHLVDEDAKEYLLKQRGLKNGERENKKILDVRVCPRCQERNSINVKYCNKCWLPLDVETAMEEMKHKEERVKADKVMDKLLEDNEFKEMFMKKLKEMND